jgi:prepilin-type N-terminal cleavage/methylation domain-containing protein
MKTKLNLQANKGMTLIELTVVILVLLSLISVLFIGAKAWKDGADRSDCIVYIGQFQKAVRSYANMREVADGGTISVSALGDYVGNLRASCKSNGTYAPTPTGSITYETDSGTVFLTCTSTVGGTHAPTSNTASW